MFAKAGVFAPDFRLQDILVSIFHDGLVEIENANWSATSYRTALSHRPSDGPTIDFVKNGLVHLGSAALRDDRCQRLKMPSRIADSSSRKAVSFSLHAQQHVDRCRDASAIETIPLLIPNDSAHFSHDSAFIGRLRGKQPD
jgi:hypothetical protein